MEEKVLRFNNLPRPNTSPTGLPNHWVFGVCHVDLEPQGDLVIAVNPKSSFLKQAGPAQILKLGTAAEKAEATISCLLDAFIKADATNSPTFAPWTWSTLDSVTAQAVQDALKKHGVKSEICRVGVCTAEEIDILESPPLLTVFPGDISRCHNCRMSRESFFVPLKKCSKCNSAYYHSRGCQKDHWKDHKHDCRRLASGTYSPLEYYDIKASVDPNAPSPRKRNRVSISSTVVAYKRADTACGLPLHRLVFTGQDTPANMKLLFGQDVKKIKTDHEDARIQVLLDPPVGSPAHVFNLQWHDPSLTRAPRPATEAEENMIKEVRQIQAMIRNRVGVGKSPSTNDMKAIIVEAFGANWVDKLPVYQLATNTIDQGVPAGGHRY
ncbi:hypothetical protein EJ06DRAFT_544006 [Trichodelitschia bisporula]|uniref:MYND-type domain-containing protein n=1 Tax=Trichodelitschia bisporula TaxID=703511 RepID=A0A6G1HSS6_9PEZI|nr:hypothetical protein EJ06DRAFT_544006 [Trichodelitschia bisporula]